MSELTSIKVGTKVIIDSIVIGDEFYTEREEFEGREATVINDPLRLWVDNQTWYGDLDVEGHSMNCTFHSISVRPV